MHIKNGIGGRCPIIQELVEADVVGFLLLSLEMERIENP
ncbi:hypothetical protein OROHE_006007 [Orobanche hederae]